MVKDDACICTSCELDNTLQRFGWLVVGMIFGVMLGAGLASVILETVICK